MDTHKQWLATLAMALIFVLSGCSSSEPEPKKSFRMQGIKQAALSYGAQKALAWQSQRIATLIHDKRHELDQIYNFNAMIMKDNIMPPVLDQNGLTLEMSNPNMLTLSQKTIKIVADARFVTTPPSWRDYVEAMQNNREPPEPSPTLLPGSAKERAVWDEAVAQGWDNGFHQANEVLRSNLGRLTRDFVGMSLFHALYAQNMVSRPYVANARMGITGDGRQVNIDQQVARIVSHAELNYHDANEWQPAIVNEPPQKLNVEAQYMDPDRRERGSYITPKRKKEPYHGRK